MVRKLPGCGSACSRPVRRGRVHQEPDEQQPVVVALLLGALADHPGQRAGALHPLGDQHGAGLLHHVGHHDVVVVAELGGEGPLGLGLELVVELLDRARLHLGDQRADVEPRDERPEAAGDPAELAQVGGQGLGRAGVLHLDGHLAAVDPGAAVHLPDRGGGGGLGVEPDQVVLPVRAQLAGEDLAHGHGGHRGRGVLQPGQLLAVRRRDLVGQRGLEDRHRLAELHRPALEVAQGAEQLLGGALLHLGQHRLGRGAADALAEAQGGAAGVPEGERGELGRARDGLAWELAHAPIVPDQRVVCADQEQPHSGCLDQSSSSRWAGSGPRRTVRDHVAGRRPVEVGDDVAHRPGDARGPSSTGSVTSGAPSARGRAVART